MLQSPIEGSRYRCLECSSYNLCCGCFSAGEHLQHNFVRRSTPTTGEQPAARPVQLQLALQCSRLAQQCVGPGPLDSNAPSADAAHLLAAAGTAAALAGAAGVLTRHVDPHSSSSSTVHSSNRSSSSIGSSTSSSRATKLGAANRQLLDVTGRSPSTRLASELVALQSGLQCGSIHSAWAAHGMPNDAADGPCSSALGVGTGGRAAKVGSTINNRAQRCDSSSSSGVALKRTICTPHREHTRQPASCDTAANY